MFLNTMTQNKVKNIIITGGSGFIGSALINHIINKTNYNVLNLDKLTYASISSSLNSIKKNKGYFSKKLIFVTKKQLKS